MTTKPPARLWSPFPNESQLALLRLVLSPRLEAGALTDWSGRVEIQRLDEGCQRLLPALYLRMTAADIAHPWLPIMRAHYQRTRQRNRLLLHRGLALARTLADHGVACLLLKGAALGAGYYADPGERPMGDFDLLLRDRAEAMAVHGIATAKQGLRLRDRALHAHTYLDRDGFEYDLHWHLLPELAYEGSEGALWARAATVRIGEEDWPTLCAEDHAYHLLAHGLRVSEVPPLRWIVDTVMVLRKTPAFDWDRLVEQAGSTETAVPIARGLAFLVREGFVHGSATKALKRLQALPQRPFERYIFAGQMQRPSLGYSILRPLLLYARLRRLAGGSLAPGVLGFMAALWDVESPRRIPAAFLVKLAGKLRGKKTLQTNPAQGPRRPASRRRGA
jgi:hypothetical protein